MPSLTAQERRDPETAARVVKDCLPDEDQRTVALEALARAIAHAHSVAPAAWTVTLYPEGIRLNVGRVETINIWHDELYFIVSSVPRELRDDLEPYFEHHPYPSVPSSKQPIRLPAELVCVFLPLLKDGILEFIYRAGTTVSGKAVKGTPNGKSFSSGVPKFLAQELGVDVVFPTWYSEPYDVLEMTAAALSGVGRPDAQHKALVERNAVQFVKERLVASGRRFIQSREVENVGYDLDFEFNGVPEHVEVKGTALPEVLFFLSRNEWNHAQSDPHFVLCVVTSALTTPTLHQWRGSEIANAFKLEPMSYKVSPRR
jgi:hypothetical protein